MDFIMSLLNLYNTNYEVKGTIQAIGFLIAFICIPELIGNHDSIESFTSAKPIVRRVVRWSEFPRTLRIYSYSEYGESHECYRQDSRTRCR